MENLRFCPLELIDVRSYPDRVALHRRCSDEARKVAGDFVEFGVYNGLSAKWILEHMPENRKLWLFDSFEGLPEDWNVGEEPWRKIPGPPTIPRGRLATNPPVFHDQRVTIVKGLFEDTLAKWSATASTLAFIHIDCDLYSSTVTVLENMARLLQLGTVVLFDEIWGYEKWKEGEWRALQEWKKATGALYEWIGRTSKCQAALRIL